MFQVIKEYAQCTIYQGRRFDIGPFGSFRQARRECQEWMDADHERSDHEVKRAPIGIGPKYAVDEHSGDFRYIIERFTEEDTDA